MKSKTAVMRKGSLRNFGIYLLPDGTEVVAVPEVDGCHLFKLENWARHTRKENYGRVACGQSERSRSSSP